MTGSEGDVPGAGLPRHWSGHTAWPGDLGALRPRECCDLGPRV